jgi:hypothetical protein
MIVDDDAGFPGTEILEGSEDHRVSKAGAIMRTSMTVSAGWQSPHMGWVLVLSVDGHLARKGP